MPADTPVLLTPDQLRALGDAAVIVDCSHDLTDPEAGRRAWALGHIPGAVHLHLDHDLSGRCTGSNGRHPLPDRATLAGTLAALGLNQGQLVVGYDRSQGPFAARLWWLLRDLGHDRVAVLDGGWQAWLAAGGAVETTPPAPRARGDFVAGASLQPRVTLADLLDTQSREPLLLVDARTPQRYAGVGETLDPVAGHIPGAVNRCYQDNLDADGRFKPAQQLRREWLQRLGDRDPASVVSSCGSGVTACHNLLALQLAGLAGARLYPGSWSEWCADPARPIARGPEPVEPAGG